MRGADGQHGDGDAVELVKAAPGTRLRQTLVDLPHRLVVHLVAAVEDVALHAKRAGQVLGCLRLTRPYIQKPELLVAKEDPEAELYMMPGLGFEMVTIPYKHTIRMNRERSRNNTCRPCGRAAEDEALCLGERDVAAVREGRDAQAAAVADELIAVQHLRVTDAYLRRYVFQEKSIFASAVKLIRCQNPCRLCWERHCTLKSLSLAYLALLGLLLLGVPQLRLPLERGSAVDALIHEALQHVARMHVNGA